jgi:hypothetical protein
VLPLYLVLGGLFAGVAMVAWSTRRALSLPIREGAAQSKIADLCPGRFRLTGRVVPIATTASEIDGAPCVYVDRSRYVHVGAGLLPLLREVEGEQVTHRFYLDDGSGRLLVDPATSLVDCAIATGECGTVAERRLRAGEEIELIALFQASERGSDDLDEGPYRSRAASMEAKPDGVGPPRISYRTIEGMQAAVLDGPGTFLRGAGAMMIVVSLLYGVLVFWLQTHAISIIE